MTKPKIRLASPCTKVRQRQQQSTRFQFRRLPLVNNLLGFVSNLHRFFSSTRLAFIVEIALSFEGTCCWGNEGSPCKTFLGQCSCLQSRTARRGDHWKVSSAHYGIFYHPPIQRKLSFSRFDGKAYEECDLFNEDGFSRYFKKALITAWPSDHDLNFTERQSVSLQWLYQIRLTDALFMSYVF